MFTGIVQDIGEIESLEPREGDLVIGIRPSALNTTLVKLGDSIAVSGACLTVVEKKGRRFEADVSPETLQKTTLSLILYLLLEGPAFNLTRQRHPNAA